MIVEFQHSMNKEAPVLQYFGHVSPVCMEDLQGYQVYKQWLMAGNTDLDVAKKLARDIAIIHQNTHVGVIGQQAIKNMNEEFQ